MNNKQVYTIHYQQKFNGEVLSDSYTSYGTKTEMDKHISDLFTDPHVFRAWYTKNTDSYVRGIKCEFENK